MTTVDAKHSSSTPLKVNDVVISLNGIKLVDVEGGMNAIVQLFTAFRERNLVVHRVPVVGVTSTAMVAPPSSSAVSATASKKKAPVKKAAAKKATAKKGAKKVAPSSAAKAKGSANSTAAKVVAEKATIPSVPVKPGYDLYTEKQRQKQLECNFNSSDSILAHFRPLKSRGTLSPFIPHIEEYTKKKCAGKEPKEPKRPYRPYWRSDKEKYERELEQHKKDLKKYDQAFLKYKKDMEAYKKLLQETRSEYMRHWRSLAREQQDQHRMDVKKAGEKFVALPPPAIESNGSNNKHALHDSTKHNATNKKQKTGSNKSAAKKTKKSDFTHDEHYMKLIANGFPEYYGSVSPCQNYYITKNNDSYNSIADTIGLDDWRALRDMEFNTNFYGQLNASTQFQKGTIIKIPTVKCSKWKLSKLIDNHEEEIKEMATCSKCLKKGT